MVLRVAWTGCVGGPRSKSVLPYMHISRWLDWWIKPQQRGILTHYLYCTHDHIFFFHLWKEFHIDLWSSLCMPQLVQQMQQRSGGYGFELPAIFDRKVALFLCPCVYVLPAQSVCRKICNIHRTVSMECASLKYDRLKNQSEFLGLVSV